MPMSMEGVPPSLEQQIDAVLQALRTIDPPNTLEARQTLHEWCASKGAPSSVADQILRYHAVPSSPIDAVTRCLLAVVATTRSEVLANRVVQWAGRYGNRVSLPAHLLGSMLMRMPPYPSPPDLVMRATTSTLLATYDAFAIYHGSDIADAALPPIMQLCANHDLAVLAQCEEVLLTKRTMSLLAQYADHTSARDRLLIPLVSLATKGDPHAYDVVFAAFADARVVLAAAAYENLHEIQAILLSQIATAAEHPTYSDHIAMLSNAYTTQESRRLFDLLAHDPAMARLYTRLIDFLIRSHQSDLLRNATSITIDTIRTTPEGDYLIRCLGGLVFNTADVPAIRDTIALASNLAGRPTSAKYAYVFRHCMASILGVAQSTKSSNAVRRYLTLLSPWLDYPRVVTGISLNTSMIALATTDSDVTLSLVDVLHKYRRRADVALALAVCIGNVVYLAHDVDFEVRLLREASAAACRPNVLREVFDQVSRSISQSHGTDKAKTILDQSCRRLYPD